MRFRLILLLLLWPLTLHANPYPDDLKPVGQANLNVLWWPIYEAQLFNASGVYKGIEAGVLLQLDYKRDIAKQDLLDKTRELWLEAELPEARIQPWLSQLQQLWRNIREQDQLSFYLAQTGQGHFFYNRRWLGVIEDVEFNKAFLNIWLSDQSAYPQLSKQLRGLSP